MVSPELIQLLRCLHTGTSLRMADQRLLDRLNRAIAEGRLRSKAGQLVTQPLEAALVSQAADVAYRIMDDIPILLRDEAIQVDPEAVVENGPGPAAATGEASDA